MSRIYSVNQNYQQKTASLKQNRQWQGKNPSFASAVNVEKDIMEGVEKKIDERFSHKPVQKAVNFFSKLFAKNEGEVQTQVINAAFTATLAPFFIAFNPFSKQDKKTKEYTALRQPISAVIAITGGYALTTVTNSWVEKLGSEGSFGKFIDMRMAPDKNYLKGQFNKDYKAATDKKAFLDQFKPEKFEGTDFDGNGIPTKKFKKACLSGYVSKVHESRKDLFTILMSENSKNIGIDEATKTIYLKDSGKKIGENIPNLTKETELKAYLNSNNLHEVEFRKILQDEFKIEFFEDGKIKPNELDKKLGDIKAMDFLRRLGLFTKGEVDEEELNRFMADVRQDQKTVDVYKGAIKPEAWVDENAAKRIIKEQGKDNTRAVHALIGETAANEETVSLRQLFNRLGINTKELESMSGEKAYDVLKNIAEVRLKDLRVAGSTVIKDGKENFKPAFLEKTVPDFAKNILTNKIPKMSSYFKNFKGYTGIFFNVFIVAITCTILNWAYPRIVERLFPSLVKEDAPKGGNK